MNGQLVLGETAGWTGLQSGEPDAALGAIRKDALHAVSPSARGLSPDSQCGRILAVLRDGRVHSVPEIHRLAGTSRLNSRVAELRRRGLDIVCSRVEGKKGAEAYAYQLRGAA